MSISSYGTINYSTTGLIRLHVDGRYLKDSSGNIVILRGISLDIQNWYPSNDAYSEQQIIYIKNWGANMLRINVEAYAIESGVLNDANFWTRLDNLINWAEAHGLYVLLNGFHAIATDEYGYERNDFSHYMDGNPRGAYAGTWQAYVNIFKQYAQRYATKSHIIYESAEEGLYCPLATWQTQMRAMIDGIRQYDSDAVCAVGAVSPADWDQQNFAFEQTYPINRPNVIYTFDEYGYHYTDNSQATIRDRLSGFGNYHWGADWMLANGRCVVVAEFGGGGPWHEGGAYNDPFTDWTATWLNNFMTVLDTDGYSGFSAWRWTADPNTWTCGKLLNDWNGNPSPYGSVIRAYYLAH
jgi:aryl-phospho-beta-D-glucosidase BglC (GH1 family)